MPKATNVQVGLSTEQGYYFLLITFSKQPEGREVTEICTKLNEHFHQRSPFFQREFCRNQIQLQPSAGSIKEMATLRSAIEEYQVVLQALGLGAWSDAMAFDEDLRPFEECSLSHPPFHPHHSKKIAINTDGLATCLLPG